MGQVKTDNKKKSLLGKYLLTISVVALVLVTGVGCAAWSTIEQWLGDSQSHGVYSGEVSRKEVSRFVKSTRHAKGNAESHYLLATYYVERDRTSEAIEEFKKAILIDRTHVKAYNGLGVCYDRLGFHKDAQQYYRTAMQVNPELDYLHNNLGYSYILDSAYEDAIDVLERAIAHGFDNPAIYNNLGVAYARTDRYELALEAFLSVGDKAAAHHNMAVEYEEAGLNEKAREHYEMARAMESGKESTEKPEAVDTVQPTKIAIPDPAEIFAQPVVEKNAETATIIETDLPEPEGGDEGGQGADDSGIPSPNIVVYPSDAAEPSHESTGTPQEQAPSAAGANDHDVAALIAPPASEPSEPAKQEDLPSSSTTGEVIESGIEEPDTVESATPVTLQDGASENQPVQSEIEIMPAVVTGETVVVNGADHQVEETLVILNDQPMITNKAAVVSEIEKPAKSSLLASIDPIVPMVEQLTRAGLSAEALENLQEQVAIQVSNGCGVRNIAHTVQDYLRQRGFHVVIADDADHHGYSKTTVYYIDPHLHDAFHVAQQIPLWQEMDEVEALQKKKVGIRILLGKDMGRFMPYFKEGVSQ